MKAIFLILIILFSSYSFAQDSEPVDATILLSQGLQKAQRTNKRVLVKFEASWCSWCKRFTKSLKDEKVAGYFEENFVVVSLVTLESENKKHLENKGAEDLLKEFGGSGAGLPYFVIMNDSAEILATSLNSFGQNIGCPATVSEVDEFIKILESTTDISMNETQSIREVFTEK